MSIFPLFARKNKVEQIIKIEPEMPKERRWAAIMKIIVINNLTDKEYIFESENDYGIGWENFEQGSILRIKQHKDERQITSVWIAQFKDLYSIVKIERREFSSYEPTK